MSGEYDINNKTTDKIWIGSSNQEYHFLTNRYKYLKDKLNSLENKIEIRLNKDCTIIVNGMADNQKIKDIFKDIY